MYTICIYSSGWWFEPIWKKIVSWDYDIPNIWKVIKFMFQTTNQCHIYISHRIHVWYIYANMDPSWVYEVFSKIFPDSVKHGQTSPASSVRHFESVPKLLWSSHRERCKMVQENNRERKRPDDVSLGCVEKYLAPHNCANLALYKLQERHISPHIYRLYRTLPSNKI
jgi:hypothetical protein